MPLSDFDAGLRVFDIEHGLRGLQPTGLVQAEMENTLLLGKATNLALHIRGLNVIGPGDVKGLRVLASEIGISAAELSAVLDELEAISWVRTKRDGLGRRLQRVEVNVPTLRDGFDTVGQRWRDLDPTEIEQASVAALADAVLRPYAEQDLVRRHGMDARVARAVVEIGETGAYLQPYRLDGGERILYSPLFSEKNPERAYALVQQYGDASVQQLVRRVRGEQGTPYEVVGGSNLLKNSVVAGLLAAPSVNDKQFLFTNQAGVRDEEADVVEKARAVLACVRFGEHYAGVSKVRYPRLILDALIDRKQLKPHSEHLTQYGLLMKRGLVRIDPVGTRHQVHVVDTPENMRALQVARDLLETGEPMPQLGDDVSQQAYARFDGTYSSTVTERGKLHRAVSKSPESVQKEYELIANLVRGALNE